MYRMRLFNDAFTGYGTILEAQEDAVPEDGISLRPFLDSLIPQLEQVDAFVHTAGTKVPSGALNRFHHVMFTYHDVKMTVPKRGVISPSPSNTNVHSRS
jgi:hypothetical protein